MQILNLSVDVKKFCGKNVLIVFLSLVFGSLTVLSAPIPKSAKVIKKRPAINAVENATKPAISVNAVEPDSKAETEPQSKGSRALAMAISPQIFRPANISSNFFQGVSGGLLLYSLRTGITSEAGLGQAIYHSKSSNSTTGSSSSSNNESTSEYDLTDASQRIFVGYNQVDSPLRLGLGYRRSELNIKSKYKYTGSTFNSDESFSGHVGRIYLFRASAGLGFSSGALVSLDADQFTTEIMSSSRTHTRFLGSAGYKNSTIEGLLTYAQSKLDKKDNSTDILIPGGTFLQGIFWLADGQGLGLNLAVLKTSEESSSNVETKDQITYELGYESRNSSQLWNAYLSYRGSENNARSDKSATGQYYPVMGLRGEYKQSFSPALNFGIYLSYMTGTGSHDSTSGTSSTRKENDSESVTQLELQGSYSH